MKKSYVEYENYFDYSLNKKKLSSLRSKKLKTRHKNYRRKRKIKRMLIRILNLSLVISSIVFVFELLTMPKSNIPNNTNNTYAISENKEEKNKDKNKILLNINEIQDTLHLQLINSDYIIVNIPKVMDITNKIPTSRKGIELETITLKKSIEMLNQAKDMGYSGIMVTSGFRTRTKQEQLYNDSEDKSFVQIPGSSEHESGLAVDIMPVDGPMESLGNTIQGQWLAENCDKFGFVLRYTEEKKQITKISPESWHFRYVGQPHAMFMKQNNICLEEYIQYLKENKEYAFSSEGINYHVHYEIPKDGKIQIPSNGTYDISSDNCGGYIVTEIV